MFDDMMPFSDMPDCCIRKRGKVYSLMFFDELKNLFPLRGLLLLFVNCKGIVSFAYNDYLLEIQAMKPKL